MGRKPKPWFRKQTKCWYINILGKQINLGRDKKLAWKRFHELMVNSTDVVLQQRVTAAEILDKFLVWTKQNRSLSTFTWYSMHLQGFIDSLENQTIEAELKRPYHLEEWLTGKKLSNSSKRGAMAAVQRAFKWANHQVLIEVMPLSGVEKPSAERRDNCPTEADFQAMLEHTSDDNFRDVLNFLWETGCRPQEVRIAESRHFQNGRIELPAKQAKGKK